MRVELRFELEMPATAGPVTRVIQDMVVAAEDRGCKVNAPVGVVPVDKLRLIEGGKDRNDAA